VDTISLVPEDAVPAATTKILPLSPIIPPPQHLSPPLLMPHHNIHHPLNDIPFRPS
jgi:hypothetical protein